MFEVNVLEDPVDEVEHRINNIFVDRFVDETDHDDLRPLIRNVLVNWEAPSNYIDTMLFVITYTANEMNNWRLFLNDETITTYFTNEHIATMIHTAERLYDDSMTRERDIVDQFSSFLAEQFIMIFENP